MQLRQAATAVGGVLHGADVPFTGCAIDSRAQTQDALFIALQGRHDGHAYVADALRGGAAAAMVERTAGLPNAPLLQVEKTRDGLARLAGHWRDRFELPVTAVTGSNGKTTVKEMLAAILAGAEPGRPDSVLFTEGNRNNELGVPLTLCRLHERHRYAVVELGASAPGEIARLARLVRPRVAAVTQCAPAHLHGFGDIDAVAAGKGEVFDALEPEGTAAINADDPYVELWRRQARARRQLRFGIEREVEVRALDLEIAFDRSRFLLSIPQGERVVDLPLPGRHNVMNALAAAACASALGLDAECIGAGLESVRPVTGRLCAKAGLRGATLLDDTYNANPGSLRAALEVLRTYPGRRVLALGDMAELGERADEWHREAGRTARDGGIAAMYSLGELAGEAAVAFGPDGHRCAGRDELIEALDAELDRGVTILIKGSRGMRMERVVAALAACPAEEEA